MGNIDKDMEEVEMISTLRLQGNSYVVTIPLKVVKMNNWRGGDFLKVKVSKYKDGFKKDDTEEELPTI